MTILAFLVLSLATYRLSDALSDTTQSGPFNMLDRIRHLLGVRFNERSEPIAETSLAEGILCPLCNSMWIAVVFVGLYLIWPEAIWIMTPLAISGVVTLLNKLL